MSGATSPLLHLKGAVAPQGGEDWQEGLCCCQGVKPPGDPAHLQGCSQQEQGGEQDVRQGDGLGAGAGHLQDAGGDEGGALQAAA